MLLSLDFVLLSSLFTRRFCWSESSEESYGESGAELILETTVLKEWFTALEEPVLAVTGVADVVSILLVIGRLGMSSSTFVPVLANRKQKKEAERDV